ncbi:hypothetical protein [Saccharothrix sp.]|uniref:hypothetical protein n=1 Tax=Saccharothrix sp. TaxID=1873460 RepID=UPI002811565F|nr:hypothetical protein [Saccharothrix sp.]
MNPNQGWPQQPHPGAPQQYQGQPPLGGAYPQQYPGQPASGPFPGHSGSGPFPGQPGPLPGQPSPYPGMPPQYPGHPGPPRKPGTAAAVVTGLLFLPIVIYTYIAAILSWEGKPPSIHIGTSVLGGAVSGYITRNIDFAITISMIIASVVLVLALVQVFRVPGVRWGLVALGAVCTIYYVYAIIRFLSIGGPSEFVIMPLVCVLLWLVPTIVAALPAVGRASRRSGPPQPGPAPPPPAQWR